jgi:hypothetical protein
MTFFSNLSEGNRLCNISHRSKQGSASYQIQKHPNMNLIPVCSSLICYAAVGMMHLLFGYSLKKNK